MRNQYVFDIPVYRTSREDFNAEIDKLVAERVEYIVSHDPQRSQLSREAKDRQFHSIIKESGGPWQFNQIVGWLRLFAEGNAIGCHPWWIDAKRLNRRMINKRLYLITFRSKDKGSGLDMRKF